MKTNKLSISLLTKISILIIFSFTVIGGLIVLKVRNYNRENMVVQSESSINSMLQVVANINSVLMQQMRTYTMFEPCSTITNPIEIQKNLMSISKKRYKDFESISYVDYNTGLEYSDNGIIANVSNLDYFKDMKSQRIPNKSNQLYGDTIDDWYSICKDSEMKDKDGYCLGFFIGKAKISYVQRFLNKLKKENSFSSKDGYYIIINTNFKYICAPDENVIGEQFTDEILTPGVVEFIKHPIDRIGKDKITVSGDIIRNGEKYSIAVGKFTKTTNWVLGAITPYKTIDDCANTLVKYIIFSAIIAVIITNIIIYLIFYFSFKPFTELNNKFIEITNDGADLTKRLRVKENNEIGQIKNNFNKYLIQLQSMIEDIKSSRDDLKHTGEDIENILAKINSKLLKFEKINDDAEIEILFRELKSEIKIFYKSINKISKNVDAFKTA